MKCGEATTPVTNLSVNPPILFCYSSTEYFIFSQPAEQAFERSSSSAGCDAEAWAVRCAVQRQIMVSRGREQD
jgi:hypothetical protein